MKAKKLPSGMWNVTVYSHMEGGKRKYMSFTAPTKAQAELRATEYKATKKRKVQHNLTVDDAVDGYIRAKEGVLSPSTIRGYIKIRNNNIAGIAQKRIVNLTSEDLQIFVSDLSASHAPKTVANIYGLVTASIALYAPDIVYRVTMPTKQKNAHSRRLTMMYGHYGIKLSLKCASASHWLHLDCAVEKYAQ